MNIKKNRTIGIRTDDHFLRLLESASKMYNASKSEIIRSAVARTYENAGGILHEVSGEIIFSQMG